MSSSVTSSVTRKKKSSSRKKKNYDGIDLKTTDWTSDKPIPLDSNIFVYNSSLHSLDNIYVRDIIKPDPSPPSQLYYANVIDRRELINIKKEENKIMIDSYKNYEYYIHYYAFDRRLDSWISANLIDITINDINSLYISTRDKQWRKDNYNDECEFKEDALRAHMLNTKVKKFEYLVIGKHRMKAWYYSPIPITYVGRSDTLYFCDFCLSFFPLYNEYCYHLNYNCKLRHPPGNEIYRSKEHNCIISVFEIDGAKEQHYCQNVSFLAKFFLDHKTLEYDTTSFFFYIITLVSTQGCHFLSYFSKEKIPEKKSFNLSCIMTLPCHQRKGLGHFMMSLSYGLSKKENKLGTPETPLSDLGLISYRKYWASQILKVIKNAKLNNESISINDISSATGFQHIDIWGTLSDLGILCSYKSLNFEKKVFSIHDKIFEKYLKTKDLNKLYPNDFYVNKCNEKLIHWTPHTYVKINGNNSSSNNIIDHCD